MNSVIARDREVQLLEQCYASNKSELVSITGRRRVGKTYLVDTLFVDRLDFRLVGIQGASRTVQLTSFAAELAKRDKAKDGLKPLKDWQFAFLSLIEYLDGLSKDRKRVVFFDELPWLATQKSDFLTFFGWFWNSWASVNNVLVIICGSAASWMINKVVKDKGGLHNRITRRLELQPFTLRETRNFLEAKGFAISDYDVAELYMAIGGIPYYLEYLSPNLSVAQNIEQAAFSAQGPLRTEYDSLYAALFDHPERHLAIVEALAKHHYGLSRKQIMQYTGLSNGGGLSRTLEELSFSGFIHGYNYFGKKRREKRYRLIDEYSNFYLKFIAENQAEGYDVWGRIRASASYASWRGYAFENLGLRHIAQIRQALGIGGVSTTTSTFYHKGNAKEKGLQMDLVIERADRAINLCEFKFNDKPIALSRLQLLAFQQRKQTFREITETDYMLFTTLVSPFGLKDTQNTGGTINQSVTLKDLFAEVRTYF